MSQPRAKKRVVYVVEHNWKETGWILRERGGDQSIWHFRTKKEAIEHGRFRCSLTGRAQLIIKKLDGKIQEERTYLDDPRRYDG